MFSRWRGENNYCNTFFCFFFYHCESLMIALMTILMTEFRLCPTQMFLSEQGHSGSRDEEVCSCGSAWHPSDLNSYLRLCFPLASRVLTTVKFSIVFGLLKDAQLFRYLIRPTPICSIPPLLPSLISRGLILDKLIFVFVGGGWCLVLFDTNP